MIIENELSHLYGGGYVYDQLIRHLPRDPRWDKLSKAWLLGKICAICGGTDKLIAHHIIPVHIDNKLELVESNWFPLCEGRISCNCHLTFGHLGNWTYVNEQVKGMSKDYNRLYMVVRGVTIE